MAGWGTQRDAGNEVRTGGSAVATHASAVRPRFWVSLLHLAALWTVACVWPLFDLLRHNAEFFVARGNTRGDVLFLAFGFALVPPIALAIAVWLAGRVRPALGRWLQVGLIGALAGLVVLAPLGDAFGGSAVAGIILAVVVGGIVAYLYARIEAVRSFATVLSVAPVAVLALFLVFSPVSKLVFSSTASAASLSTVKSDTPVVWVTFDELPTLTLMNAKGEIDAKRMPNFARLARDATWYRDATTVSDATAHAVPALLSGTRPTTGELPTARDHPHNLFTMLGSRYRFNVVEPLTDLCPPRLCPDKGRMPTDARLRSLAKDLSIVEGRLLLPRDLRDELPATDQNWQGFGGGGTRKAAAVSDSAQGKERASFLARFSATDPVRSFHRFVARIRPDGRKPSLNFAHLVIPHVPWHYLPTGQRYPFPSSTPGLADEQWGSSRMLVDLGWQRHMLQTGAADHMLGAILDRLHETKLYNAALIIVAADHGVSFRPDDPRRKVTKTTFPDIAGPPLLVKLPGQKRGRVDDAPVRTIDILPTVAKVLDLKLPGSWHLDGVPLGSRTGDHATVTVATSGNQTVSVRFSSFVRARDARLAYQSQLLMSSGRGGDNPYGLGAPDARLLGRPLSQLRIGRLGEARATLDDPGALTAARPSGSSVPAYLSGELTGLRAGQPIAIALNGRIAATTRAYTEDGVVKFAALAPPGAFRQGPNTVRAYEIGARGLLQPLAPKPLVSARALTFTLTSRGARRQLRGSGGSIEISADAAKGYVGVERSGASLEIGGWAVRRDLKGPVGRVAAFVGDRLVGATKPSVERADVVKALHGDEALLRSGFALTLPVSKLRCSDVAGGLHVFGVVGRKATELKQFDDVAARLRSACHR